MCVVLCFVSCRPQNCTISFWQVLKDGLQGLSTTLANFQIRILSQMTNWWLQILVALWPFKTLAFLPWGTIEIYPFKLQKKNADNCCDNECRSSKYDQFSSVHLTPNQLSSKTSFQVSKAWGSSLSACKCFREGDNCLSLCRRKSGVQWGGLGEAYILLHGCMSFLADSAGVVSLDFQIGFSPQP